MQKGYLNGIHWHEDYTEKIISLMGHYSHFEVERKSGGALASLSGKGGFQVFLPIYFLLCMDVLAN